MILPAGTSHDVFFKKNGLPIQGNPVVIVNYERTNHIVHATDSFLNERIFRLHDFTIKPAVKALKLKPKK